MEFFEDWLDENLKASSGNIPVPRKAENKDDDSKGKPSSSPVFASFLDKWMKGLFSSDSTTKSVDQKPSLRDSDSPLRKSFRKEVRSVFGWTDLSEAVDEVEQEEQQVNKQATYSKQDSLPRLPIPSLRETCNKYLKTLEPILLPDQLEISKQYVEEFLQPGGIGEMLQQKLLERDQGDLPSWLEEWWDDAYLYGRESIAINVNYFFAFEDDPIADKNNQIGRAASLLRGAMLFHQSLRSEQLTPDMERDKALCMSQYPRLFGSSRIPQQHRDKLYSYTKYRPQGRDAWSQTTEYVDMDPNHVVVLYKNQFYWFDIFVNGQLLPLPEIEANLYRVTALTHSSGDIEPPVGVFTAQDRPVWSSIRDQLISIDSLNHQTLEKIQSALMVVVLDSSSPTTYEEVARVILHGPITNRWFDKHQLIICANGKAGMCFEHAVGDGSTTLRLADEMYKYSVSNTRTWGILDSSVQTFNVSPNKLKWKLNEEIIKSIEECYDNFKAQILANETSALVFHKFGGQFIKDSNMSPDAFAQIAIQLAYYKLLGKSDPTYESASTKQFLHGRTETVRSVSNESVAFVRSTSDPIMTVLDNQVKLSLQHKLLFNARNAHVKYMRDAKEGKGVDRHLFGLRMIFEQQFAKQGLPTPSIFTDDAYKKSSHWQISTSHCGSSSLSLFGFGPVVSDGFGVGYMIKNNSISFVVTSKNSQAYTSSHIFVMLLEQSLMHLQSIAMSHPDKLAAPSKSLNFTHPTNSAAFHYLDWTPSSQKSKSPLPN